MLLHENEVSAVSLIAIKGISALDAGSSSIDAIEKVLNERPGLIETLGLPTELGNVPLVSYAFLEELLLDAEQRSLSFSGATHKRINAMAEEVGLNACETGIFHLAYLFRFNRALYFWMNELRKQHSFDSVCELVAILLGVDTAEAYKAMASRGALRQYGILQDIKSFMTIYDDIEDFLNLESKIVEHFATGSESGSLVDLFVYPAEPTSLTMADFRHMGPILTMLRDYLAALYKGAPGTRCILLEGAPGVGKTELCRVLADTLGVEAFKIAHSDRDGQSRDPSARVRAWRAADEIMKRRYEYYQTLPLLIFDEVEEVFSSETRGQFNFTRAYGGSKAFLNHMLETVEVPVILVTNTIGTYDKAFLSRMWRITVPDLPERHRTELLRAHAELKLSPKFIRSISRDPAVRDPRRLVSVIERATTLGATGKRAELLIAQQFGFDPKTLQPKRKRKTSAGEIRFEPSWLRIREQSRSVSPEEIATFVTNNRGVIILFEGEPGTGKTGLARFLAARRKSRLITVRPSDVLDPFLGVSEQQLNNRFRQVDTQDAVMLIDEVDSVAYNRSGATHSWERTLVNQLLSNMDEFRAGKGVLLMTTNVMGILDPAFKRRCDRRLSFDYLDETAFRSILNRVCRRQQITLSALRAEQLKQIFSQGRFSVSDFVTIDRQLRLSSVGDRFDMAAAMMEQIAAERPVGRKVGFH
ncbi:MAG: AAA family ATPase [Pseudomonadota bacterium]